MKQRIQQILQSGNRRRNILLLSISVILGLCIAISVIGQVVFQYYLRGTLIQSTETNLRLIAGTIDDGMEDVYRIVRYCQTNSDIATYVTHNPEPGSVLSVSTYDTLNEECQRNASYSYMPRIAVVTKEHYLQVVTALYSSTNDLAAEIPELPYYEDLLTAEDYDYSTGLISDPFHRIGRRVLPILRPLYYQYNSRQAGYVFIEVSESLFTDPLDDLLIGDDCTFYLTIAGHTYQYEDGVLVEITPDYTYREDLSQYARSQGNIITRIYDSGHTDQILVSTPLDMTDCYISLSLSHAARASQVTQFTALLICILIVILAISLLLMNHRLEQERQRQDLEYKMLQSQINPHFLYNTLNSIKWMATIQGASGIAEMTTSLSRLLRSISKGTSLLIDIREELSLLESYYTIQSYRYGGTITMETQVDEDALYDCEIIKFTLQPLVENAIFHGIEPKGTGTIRVHVGYEQQQDHQNIRIDVTDDGVGIAPDKIQQILSGTDNSKTEFFREIGVSNVHKRIQYQYGSRYGITIESVLGEYTTMSVHLPYRTHKS